MFTQYPAAILNYEIEDGKCTFKIGFQAWRTKQFYFNSVPSSVEEKIEKLANQLHYNMYEVGKHWRFLGHFEQPTMEYNQVVYGEFKVKERTLQEHNDVMQGELIESFIKRLE